MGNSVPRPKPRSSISQSSGLTPSDTGYISDDETESELEHSVLDGEGLVSPICHRKHLSNANEDFILEMERNARTKALSNASSSPSGTGYDDLHQWNTFVGGKLNTTSRQHKPHHLFTTTPDMSDDVLLGHVRSRGKSLARPPLSRRNSSNSLELCLTIDELDAEGMMKVTALVLHYHIVQGCGAPHPGEQGAANLSEKYRVFDDSAMQQSNRGGAAAGCRSRLSYTSGQRNLVPPTYDDVYDFYLHVYRSTQLEKDCIIMSLIYIERLLMEAAGELRICAMNWRSVVLAGMVMASKVWDDLSMWNCDFSKVGRLNLRRINELEVAMLTALQYNVRVEGSLFARYYFHLRDWCMRIGAESPGLYKSPKLKAKERDNLFNIGGRDTNNRLKDEADKHASDGLGFTSPYSRLPPCLEELVDMRQIQAGGHRAVHPRELKDMQLSHRVCPALRRCCSLRDSGSQTGMRRLILNEAGDVQATYEVNQGEGRILGVGISGVVQIVRHRKTGKRFAMKTLKLGRLEDFQKMNELRNEMEIMSALDHPNIVKLLEVHESPGSDTVHLIMELCTGGELLGRLNASRHCSERTCAGIVRRMLQAIEHCHMHGICHRDLKLENWVFESSEENAELKLIDFGLSRHFETGEVMHVPVGTVYTVAPEVLSGCYTQACDLWSIGVLTYMLLTGEPPFKGKSDYEVLEAVKCASWGWPANHRTKSSMTSPPTHAGAPGQQHSNYSSSSNHQHCSPPLPLCSPGGGSGLSLSLNAKDFVEKLLVLDPKRRPSASEALCHPWIQSSYRPKEERSRAYSSPNMSDDVRESLDSWKALSALKVEVMRLVCNMRATGLEHLRHELTKRDSASSGLVSLAELHGSLLAAGLLAAHPQLAEAFDRVRLDAPGVIRYNDWLEARDTQLHPGLDDSILHTVFNKLDTAKRGTISPLDVEKFLGQEMDEDEAKQLVHKCSRTYMHTTAGSDHPTDQHAEMMEIVSDPEGSGDDHNEVSFPLFAQVMSQAVSSPATQAAAGSSSARVAPVCY
ncbi:unnamed protein product [Chrysoparadoxa australica]